MLNFGQAIEVMKDFGKGRLPFWNKNTHVSLDDQDEYSHDYFVVNSDKGAVPWMPTYPEMLSDEWERVRAKPLEGFVTGIGDGVDYAGPIGTPIPREKVWGKVMTTKSAGHVETPAELSSRIHSAITNIVNDND